MTSVTGNLGNMFQMGWGESTCLPSLSSSCVSMASMASMVAEGGGGEQVTPDKAMQMSNAAPAKRRLVLGQVRYTCLLAIQPNSEERHALILRELM